MSEVIDPRVFWRRLLIMLVLPPAVELVGGGLLGFFAPRMGVGIALIAAGLIVVATGRLRAAPRATTLMLGFAKQSEGKDDLETHRRNSMIVGAEVFRLEMLGLAVAGLVTVIGGGVGAGIGWLVR